MIHAKLTFNLWTISGRIQEAISYKILPKTTTTKFQLSETCTIGWMQICRFLANLISNAPRFHFTNTLPESHEWPYHHSPLSNGNIYWKTSVVYTCVMMKIERKQNRRPIHGKGRKFSNLFVAKNNVSDAVERPRASRIFSHFWLWFLNEDDRLVFTGTWKQYFCFQVNFCVVK